MSKKTLSLSESFKLTEKEYQHLYRKHINPGLLSIYKILGFTKMNIESAQGLEMKMQNGKTVLDFTSGLGVLGLGHNHPKIIKAEQLCHQLLSIDVQKFGINRLQSVLAYNISQVLPQPLDTSFFTVSGAEAVEAGIKLITRAQPDYKEYFITFNEDYHGKTHGALSFTDSENFASGFHTGIPRENIIVVEPGNIEALKNAIQSKTFETNKNSIAAVIMEPIQGQTLNIHPKGYLEEAASLCKENDILILMDEIKVGMGRTGKLFAFFEEKLVPDILTISKALGGGKRAIGVMVTSAKLSKKAYGKRKDSALHSTTFGGLGSSCAVAIESLNIISDQNFLENVEKKGSYFLNKLHELKNKYPKNIQEIVGKGLYLGIIFNFNPYEKSLKKIRIPFINDMRVALMGSIVRCLYRKYGLLTHFTPPKPNMLVIMPPLIIEKEQIDYFIDSVDSILKIGFLRLFGKFVIDNAKSLTE